MRKIRWICLLGLLLWPWAEAQATGWRKYDDELYRVNKRIAGKVMDYTANHGHDNRIWSRTLFQRRDLYVYLPPGYQPCERYPFMIWLHGFNQDERWFLRHVVPLLDEAIRCGKLPPLIVAAPDGTFKGEADPIGHQESFFLNSPQGDFADYVLQDVWDFVANRYPIRQEREAHILAGVTMGGFAAYNFAIKHRQAFGTVIGIMPPLNMRWADQRGHLHAKFDPRDWGWKDAPTSKLRSAALYPVSKAYQMHRWMERLYGDEGAIMDISRENPIEMLNRYHVWPCQLEMYIAYIGNDHYNIDAQVDSFLYLAHWRRLHITVDYEPHALHSTFAAKRFLPGAFRWLAPRIAPYSPVMACEACCYSEPVACDAESCPTDACPPSLRRRLFHRRHLPQDGLHRHQPHDDGSYGYPHTLPDPAYLNQ